MDLSRITPGQMMAMRTQIQQMMAGAQDGPVNWTMGRSLALQEAAKNGDPAITAGDAEATRQALQMADL